MNRNRSLLFVWLLVLGVSSPAFAADPVAAPAPDAGFNDPTAIRVLLVPDTETTLSSQMTGTIAEMSASLGKTVEYGAPLVSFDCREGLARSKMANAELTSAKRSLSAKSNLRKLEAAGDLEVSLAVAEVDKAEAAKSLLDVQNSYCHVVAPFPGKVAKVYVKPFQTISAGTPLVDLVSDALLKVRLNVPSNLMPKLQVGTPLTVSIAETGKQYAAHLIAINARVDAVAQSIELEARLDEANPDLVAGMSGIAKFAATQ